MAESEWYYIDDNGQKGPVSEADLAALQRDGRLSGATLIWRKGQGSWSPLAETLPAISETPPPLPAGLSAPRASRKRAKREPWSDTSPHPWRRYFARMFDLYIVGIGLLFLLAVIISVIDPVSGAKFGEYAGEDTHSVALGYLILSLGFVANILFLGFTGSTLGKWIFGIVVTRPDGRPMGLGTAFKREINVFLSGLGLGIPFVALFTMVGSFRTLKQNGITSWDKDYSLSVRQRPNSFGQIVLCVAAVAGALVLIGMLNAIK